MRKQTPGVVGLSQTKVKSASIHQPTFLPWMGFFGKICRSNIYVVLDHTLNNPKDPQLLLRRTQLIVERMPKWISLPVKKISSNGGKGIEIAKFEYLEIGEREQRKLMTSLKASYCRCRYFDDVWPFLEGMIWTRKMNLAERNIKGIEYMINWLGLEVKIRRSSEMGLEPGKRKDDMIIEILKNIQAEEYIHGRGASSYHNPEVYSNAGIQLKQSPFIAKEYPQECSSFVGGMSMIDAMMNISRAELLQHVMADD